MTCVVSSVTRLGDLWYFGQLFKAFGNNYFAQIAHILGNSCKAVKIFHFSNEIIFGLLLQIFGNFLLVTLVVSQFRDGAKVRNSKVTLNINLESFLAMFIGTTFIPSHSLALAPTKKLLWIKFEAMRSCEMCFTGWLLTIYC